MCEQSFRLTPHLWKKVPANKNYGGRAVWKYKRRNFNLELWESVEANLIANNVDIGDVIGAKADRAMSFLDVPDQELDAHHMGEPLEQPTQLAEDIQVQVNELVDVAMLEHYMQQGDDRRWDQTRASLEEVKAKGTPAAVGWLLPRTYFRKSIADRATGRLHGPTPSLQAMTREARAACCGNFAVDVDMVNAFVNILDGAFNGNLPMLRRHMPATLHAGGKLSWTTSKSALRRPRSSFSRRSWARASPAPSERRHQGHVAIR